MNPCFQLLFSLFIRSLGLSDPKLKLKRFFSLVEILMNLRCRL
jgi:hypothetical protein